MKLNSKGFGAIEWVLVVVVILGVGAGGFYILSQNDDDSSADMSDGAEESEDQESEAPDDTESLEASQNDAQRKTDIANFLAIIDTYAANNNGNYPTDEQILFEQEFLDETYVDPASGEVYEFVSGSEPAVGQIQYELGFDCFNINTDDEPGGLRIATAQTRLENGELYCQDNR